MSALKSFRADVTARLKDAGIVATDHFPAVLSAPGAVLAYGVPYLTPGDAFCEITANLDLVLFVGTGDNATSTHSLDTLIEDAIDALWEPYGPLEVQEPYILQVQGADHLAAQIRLTSHFSV